ncbi:hypothetical protein D3C76_804640 [compost metagenome]
MPNFIQASVPQWLQHTQRSMLAIVLPAHPTVADPDWWVNADPQIRQAMLDSQARSHRSRHAAAKAFRVLILANTNLYYLLRTPSLATLCRFCRGVSQSNENRRSPVCTGPTAQCARLRGCDPRKLRPRTVGAAVRPRYRRPAAGPGAGVIGWANRLADSVSGRPGGWQAGARCARPSGARSSAGYPVAQD